MVNTACALKFTTPCKLASKCGIYHICFWFTPSSHFFTPYLHRVNLSKSNFSCSVFFSEDVIYLSLRSRWITPSSICRILHIVRKPNSIIAKYFWQIKTQLWVDIFQKIHSVWNYQFSSCIYYKYDKYVVLSVPLTFEYEYEYEIKFGKIFRKYFSLWQSRKKL